MYGYFLSNSPDTLPWTQSESFKDFIFKTMPDCTAILCAENVATIISFSKDMKFVGSENMVVGEGMFLKGFLKGTSVIKSNDLTEDQFILVNTKTGESKLGMITH